ncbi:hypothetical protein PFISCL1PPCAC_22122, partial [Pristionchus fissidentatus]
ILAFLELVYLISMECVSTRMREVVEVCIMKENLQTEMDEYRIRMAFPPRFYDIDNSCTKVRLRSEFLKLSGNDDPPPASLSLIRIGGFHLLTRNEMPEGLNIDCAESSFIVLPYGDNS